MQRHPFFRVEAQPLLKVVSAIALTATLLVVAGCGFALRGSDPTVSQLKSIRLTATNQYGPLVMAVEKSLQGRDVEVNSDEAGAYHLHIVGERSSRRAVSTTSQISVAEYELQVDVDFQLKDALGDWVLPLTTVVAERTYSFDRGSFMGNSEQERLLMGEMQVDLIDRMISRVSVAVRNDIAKSAQSPVRQTP
jgi:LPS-assembly lipoprotein